MTVLADDAATAHGAAQTLGALARMAVVAGILQDLLLQSGSALAGGGMSGNRLSNFGNLFRLPCEACIARDMEMC